MCLCVSSIVCAGCALLSLLHHRSNVGFIWSTLVYFSSSSIHPFWNAILEQVCNVQDLGPDTNGVCSVLDTSSSGRYRRRRRQRNGAGVRYLVCLTFSNENSSGEIIFGLCNCGVRLSERSICGRMRRWDSDANTVAHIKLSFTKTFQTTTLTTSRIACPGPHTVMLIGYSRFHFAERTITNQNVVDALTLSFIRSIQILFSLFLFWPLFI